MPLLTQRVPDEDEQYCLVASLDNVRNLSTVLKAIHFKEHAACFATKNGLKVTVENAKCVQANAFIQAEVFQEFIIQEESVTFRINLTILLDCLSIFGSSPTPGTLTALRMCYQGYGHPLLLFLEEGGVVTVCKINTQEPEETLDFDFCSTNVINKIILQSEGLREAFSELDMTSDVLQITVSPDKPYFRLSTFGNAGSSHLDYPKDSDLVEAFHCNKTQINRYKLALLKPSTKALALSCKVSIRTDNRGFLSLQYMIRNEDGQDALATIALPWNELLLRVACSVLTSLQRLQKTRMQAAGHGSPESVSPSSWRRWGKAHRAHRIPSGVSGHLGLIVPVRG